MNRYAGVLLSVTSLPSAHGIGCFDKTAYDFVDFLCDAGQRYWQILPLSATASGPSDDSPYQAYSAFAGNPFLIDLEALTEQGLLTREELLAADFGSTPETVDFAKLRAARFPLLHKAYERANVGADGDFAAFCAENGAWLHDYALFMALKTRFGDVPFSKWPEDIRMHWDFAVDYYSRELYFDIEFHKYMQYLFFTQWRALKDYANARGVLIVGDIPIYVSPDGADVWAHSELFQLDARHMPTAIAGCPPDAFAADGQVWKNPLYRWEVHAADGFAWWISRMRHSFALYDVVRLDHFRGFDAYFSIPADEDTARNGHWEDGPGMALFDAIRGALGDVRMIAEDLGTMTESVRELVRASGYPNMKVIQFAVDPSDDRGWGDHWPHNYESNCVAYTGTHDNDTLAGWFDALDKAGRAQLRAYLCAENTPDAQMPEAVIALAMRSAARDCIVPMQDYLGLGSSARMNRPGTVGANWRWRMLPNLLTPELAARMHAFAARTGRLNWA